MRTYPEAGCVCKDLLPFLEEAVCRTMAFQQRDPSVPFTHPIEGGLSKGKGIKIKGRIQDPAERFELNLVCANGDVAFHFNPRFDEGPVVVCNTMQDGRWGAEERAPDMPFQRDASFKATVVLRSHCYQVFVNRKHFLDYQHRLPVGHIQALEIKGDIDLKKVTLKDIQVSDPSPEYLPGAGSFI